MIWADNMAYWYQGEEFTELDTLMEAVRLDVDGYFGDSDLDSVIAGIVDRLRNSVELGELPADVPYTSGTIESDM